MSWRVEYYQKENGTIPVAEFLLSLDAKMRAKAFSEIELLEKHGFELKEPYVKPIVGAKYRECLNFELNLHRISVEFSIFLTMIAPL